MSVGYDLYLRLLEEACWRSRASPWYGRPLYRGLRRGRGHSGTVYPPPRNSGWTSTAALPGCRTQEEGDDITDELIDRYGDPPVGVANLIAIALLRARAAALGITELVQKEGSLRFSLPQPDFAKVAAVCGLEKYKGRLLFSAGDKPYLSLRLKKGDDVLKLAGIVLRDFEAAG